MERRHLKHPVAGQLERRHLDDDRNGLQHKQTADDHQNQFMLGHDRHCAECCAQRERSGIAHEDHGGWGVEPQKPEPGADHRGAKHGQFADAGDIVNLQISAENGIADHIADQRKADRRDHDRHDRQAV